MLNRILILLFVASLITAAAQAQNYKTAIGLRLSSNPATVNNSISVKHFINRVVALEGLVSIDPAAVGGLIEVHQPVSSVPGLRWMFGGGGYVNFKNEVSLGTQGLLGLDYKFINFPINLSADWKPELNVTHEFAFEPAVVGFSARFTLK
jgi:hypothetical protein